MDPMPGGDDNFYADGDIEDGLLESLAIIALAGALALLVVYRRRRADERQANGDAGAARNGAPANAPVDEQGQVQPDDGLFPHPGDPEFPGWAVGGVGH
jgi:SEL1 protein